MRCEKCGRPANAFMEVNDFGVPVIEDFNGVSMPTIHRLCNRCGKL